MMLYDEAMTSAVAAAEHPRFERLPFEEQLFVSSPLGTGATAALIFVLDFSSFLAISWLTHYWLFWPGGVVLKSLAPGVASALYADRLAVIGRQSARNALVWFVNAAVVCLFFIGGDVGPTTVLMVVGCAGMGLWIFLSPMTGVHHRIRAAKSLELDRVRDEIAEASRRAAGDTDAAVRLSGLIAYEARIQAVRDWPFDQSTLIRVAAYVLIPTIPWVGEAIVSTAVQHLAH
jgi:hypothetical protein